MEKEIKMELVPKELTNKKIDCVRITCGNICAYNNSLESVIKTFDKMLSRRVKMSNIEKQKDNARNLNELTDHLIKLIESDDKRFSFEFCVNEKMEIYDKENEIGYMVNITPIE